MSREKGTWLPIVFCLFLTPYARSLADEVKKEKKDTKKIDMMLGIVSAGGLVASFAQLKNCNPKDESVVAILSGLGFIVSLVCILHSLEPLIEQYVDPYLGFGKHKEKVAQKNQSDGQERLKMVHIVHKGKKKKKLRKRIKEFFASKIR